MKFTTVAVSCLVYCVTLNAQYEYEHWLLGSTYYDCQHQGSQGKQIVVGDNGVIHFAWIKEFTMGQHIAYACFIDGNVFGGISIADTGDLGACTIDVLDDDATFANSAVVAYHQQPGTDFVTALSPD